MGRVGAVIGLGLVIGPVLGSAISHLHPNAPPLAAALFAFADLAGVYFLMPETRQAAPAAVHDGPPRRALRHVLTEAPIAAIMAIYFLTFICMTNVQVSLGRGDGTFAAPVQSSFVGAVMNTTDLNRDGRRDVIAETLPAAGVSTIVILPGTGTANSRRSPFP